MVENKLKQLTSLEKSIDITFNEVDQVISEISRQQPNGNPF